MKLLQSTIDVFVYPYKEGMSHLHKAQESPMGRYRVVHYVVGGLEFIPVVNYVIVAVDQLVRIILNRLYREKKPRPQIPAQVATEPVQRTLEGFLGQYKIVIDSPLMLKIGEIKKEQNEWKEGDEAWEKRIIPLKKAIESIGDLVPSEDQKQWKDLLQQLQSSNQKIGLIFKSFHKQLEGLGKKEEERKTVYKEKIEEKIKRFQKPVVKTLEEYLFSLGITSEQILANTIGHSLEKMLQRGIHTVADIDRLQLRKWDSWSIDLEIFQFIQDNNTAEVYKMFLTTLKTKWIEEAQSDGAPYDFVGAVDLFKEIKDPQVADFRAFFITRQTTLLKGYLNQDRCLDVWNELRKSAPLMTLDGLCGLYKFTTLTSLFRIGDLRDQLNQT